MKIEYFIFFILLKTIYCVLSDHSQIAGSNKLPPTIMPKIVVPAS